MARENRSPPRVDDDQRCVAWGLAILEARGFGEWKIDFTVGDSAEGIVIFKTKTICIHWPQGKPDFALMLHEIAHLNPRCQGHNSEFAMHYLYLVKEFMIPVP